MSAHSHTKKRASRFHKAQDDDCKFLFLSDSDTQPQKPSVPPIKVQSVTWRPSVGFTLSRPLHRSTTATPPPSTRMTTSWAEADRCRRRSPSCLLVSVISGRVFYYCQRRIYWQQTRGGTGHGYMSYKIRHFRFLHRSCFVACCFHRVTYWGDGLRERTLSNQKHSRVARPSPGSKKKAVCCVAGLEWITKLTGWILSWFMSQRTNQQKGKKG